MGIIRIIKEEYLPDDPVGTNAEHWIIE